MEPEEYVKMNRLEDTYWWFVGRRDLILTVLPVLIDRFSNRTQGIAPDSDPEAQEQPA